MVSLSCVRDKKRDLIPRAQADTHHLTFNYLSVSVKINIYIDLIAFEARKKIGCEAIFSQWIQVHTIGNVHLCTTEKKNN